MIKTMSSVERVGPDRSLNVQDMPSVPPYAGGSMADDEITSVISRRDVSMLFQPIVDLETGQTVAYEALARGPAGSNLESPAALFGQAAQLGIIPELDLLCRAQALTTAARSPQRDKFVLFVNGEPAHLPPDGDLAPYVDQASRAGRTVLEIAERSVFDRPADLLLAVADARRRGWGIAVDDVGKTTDSLGLLPIIDPDVIKLDMSIIQDRPGRTTGLTLNAVIHHVERSGCLVLAEGIETEEHLARAKALGATLGQGWFFGRPGPVPSADIDYGPWRGEARIDGLRQRESSGVVAPFQLVEDSPRLRRGTKEVLYALSLDIEAQAASQPDGAVVFGCFQRDMHLTAATRRRYERLATRGSLVAALGHSIDPAPAEGVRGVAVPLDDPLVNEWTVVVLSSHFSAALIAHDLGDEGPDGLRRFDYVITYDRDLVIDAARLLFGRVMPYESFGA